MKIAFVLDDGLDKPDGVQQYILTLGKYYKSIGHEVHYLVGETKRSDIPNVHSLAKNVAVRFNGNRLSIPLPSSRRRIAKLMRQEQFDVVHVQVPYSPFMGALVIAEASKNTKVIGTFHILPYGLLSKVGTRLLGLSLKRNIRRFDHMVSVSEPARVFAQTFGVQSTVVPNSVPIKDFQIDAQRDARDEALRIVFLGRLVERKGCHKLIKALILLKKQTRLPQNVHIDICGDGPDRSKLENMVRSSNLTSQVTFHGFVTEEQKRTFLHQADVAIFPSLSGESFGIVLIEAMASGSGVVLAGKNPGYQSVLGSIPNSMIDVQDISAMANQIAIVLGDPVLRADLHRQQQEYVKQFDTAVVAKKLLELYEA
jgi:phosphatidyl-myo-inositol alpha-mannosyltransferase